MNIDSNMESPGARHAGGSSETTLSEWARSREPDLYVTSKSEPEPVLLEHNLIAVVRDPDVSRDLLLKWERIQQASAGIGFVAMSRSAERPPTAYESPARQPATGKADPQKVGGHTMRKILRGGIPGLVIGALLVGIMLAILDSDSSSVLAGALAGAAFGFAVGAVISFVAGTGWSEAYKESFVEPAATDVIFASIHSDQPEMIADAMNAADLPADTLLRIDRTGRPVLGQASEGGV